jgi:hypothetical protein
VFSSWLGALILMAVNIELVIFALLHWDRGFALKL